MGFTCGIAGLPNVGKSTLFNALTAAHAEVANYPFSTIDPNIGVVAVPDKRLDHLFEIYKPQKKVPTTIEFMDIAGLVKGASKGEGLGNQFLSHIRNVDAIVHIVRCFDDPNIVHIDSVIDPKRDIEIVETELLLKDLETVERKLHEVDKHAKSGDKKAKIEYDFYHRLKDFIASGRLVHYFNTTHDDEKHFLRNLHLLTNKPVMYVCNIHERDIKNEISFVTQVREIAAKENAKVVIISAEVEAEIAELPEDERPAFLSELGLKESGLNQVIREGYDLLHLITFFTVAEKEVHARTVPKGTLAPQAAGTVHTDFEKGFIKAEIIKYKDIDRLGSDHAVKERGLFHIHGHDYVMEDGDIAFFRFNV